MELYSDKTPDSLRAHADQLDQDAANLLREANARADELRRRARDYRGLAAREDAAQRPRLCVHCGQQIVPFELGWRHVIENGCPTAEPSADVPVAAAGAYPPPTAPTPQVERPDGETLVQPVVPPGGEPS